jgi:cytochrome c5
LWSIATTLYHRSGQKMTRQALLTTRIATTRKAATRLGLAAWLAVGITTGAQSSRTMWDGAFTAPQADRGEARYKASCASCHAEDLLGGSGPALVGEAFFQRWTDQAVADLLLTVRQTMPQDAPDSLGTAGYVDLLAFLLKRNGAPAGSGELSQDPAVLKDLRITKPPPSR